MDDDKELGPGWTTQQLGTFIDHISDDRFAALWLLVATSGLPPDVLAGLRRSEVDLQERRLFPERRSTWDEDAAGPSAPRRAQGYGLDPTTYDVLRDHVIAWDKERESSSPDARHLFLGTDGQPVRSNDVTTMFEVHCKRAGLPVVPMEAVRQTYVMNALHAGIPTQVLSDRVGRSGTPEPLRPHACLRSAGRAHLRSL
jgi:integrase